MILSTLERVVGAADALRTKVVDAVHDMLPSARHQQWMSTKLRRKETGLIRGTREFIGKTLIEDGSQVAAQTATLPLEATATGTTLAAGAVAAAGKIPAGVASGVRNGIQKAAEFLSRIVVGKEAPAV